MSCHITINAKFKGTGRDSESLLGRVLGGCVLEALNPVDGPEVVGKCGVANVLVRHVEVALVAPPASKKLSRKAAQQQEMHRNPITMLVQDALLPKSCGR